MLRIGQTLYVGLSSRSDAEGIAELKRVAGRCGFEVVAAELRGCLHLKTAATFAGHDPAGRPLLLYNNEAVDPRQFPGVEPMASAVSSADTPTASRSTSTSR